MKIIQNFSSKKHIKSIPITDILIWYIGLFKLKELGHTVKLYCEEKDFTFLKKWGLYKFFDEFDTEFLSSDPIIQRVNGENFWSIRKIECIDHEFQISEEPFIYLDTDVIMNVPLRQMGHLMVWSPEESELIYPKWEHLSVPNGYIMPDFIKETDNAFNCGLLSFASYEIFQEYRKLYLDFVLNNPCIISGINESKQTKRSIWACCAEQRILKAFATHYNLHTVHILERQDFGANDFGIHFYYYRDAWELLNKGLFKDDQARLTYWSELLNFHLQQFLTILINNDEEGFNIFMKVKWLYELFYENKKVTKYK